MKGSSPLESRTLFTGSPAPLLKWLNSSLAFAGHLHVHLLPGPALSPFLQIPKTERNLIGQLRSSLPGWTELLF